jgi:large subunit ribosomal protein L29
MSKSEFTSKTLSEISVEKLTEKFVLLKKELFNLRFQKKLGELTNTSRFAQVRKDVARVKTEISKRRKANA